MSTGRDFTFDRIYAFLAKNGPSTARDITEGIGRSRSSVDIELRTGVHLGTFVYKQGFARGTWELSAEQVEAVVSRSESDRVRPSEGG